MKRRYRDFSDNIDIDAFEEAIDFEPLESKQDNDIGYCPDVWGLHNNGDTTGKFGIHRDKKLYNCWVCGGGTLLSLAMSIKDMGEQEATDWIYQFATEDNKSDESFLDEIDDLLTPEAGREAPTLPWFNEKVVEKWIHNISEQADWLQRRGISSTVAREYKLGYDEAHTRLSSKGDYTGPAIIIPHFWGGRIVGWQERWLEDQPQRPKHIPKYTNTGDFPRGFTIYNFERNYLATKPIVVSESNPTVLLLESLGQPAVGTFGSSVTFEQMLLLRRYTQGVILAPDNDMAGVKFADSLTEYLETYIPVRTCLPLCGEGSDLGDVADDPDFVMEVVQSAEEYL